MRSGRPTFRRPTFLDSSVLIAAACGVQDVAANAIAILQDSTRAFFSSDLVKLEVLPKPMFNGYELEVAFYEDFFQHAQWIKITSQLIEQAFSIASRYGLSALDALHVASALQVGAEFVTGEKKGKPIYRVKGLSITSIRPDS